VLQSLHWFILPLSAPYNKSSLRAALLFVADKGNKNNNAISQENSMRFEADQFFADAGVLQAHRGGK